MMLLAMRKTRVLLAIAPTCIALLAVLLVWNNVWTVFVHRGENAGVIVSLDDGHLFVDRCHFAIPQGRLDISYGFGGYPQPRRTIYASWTPRGDYVPNLGYQRQLDGMYCLTDAVAYLGAVDELVLPLWPLLVPVTLITLVLLRREARRARRVRAGCCANCGYDLRASHDRCPECGRRARSSGTDAEMARLS